MRLPSVRRDGKDKILGGSWPPVCQAPPVNHVSYVNFELGMRGIIQKGDTLMIWDDSQNKFLMSTMLPSWEDFEESMDDSFNLLCGLYERDEIKVHMEMSIGDLAYQISWSILRSAPLSCLIERRGARFNQTGGVARFSCPSRTQKMS
ncbi:hypothetical protein KSP40_PGU005138 [Platanthera guangdongensis]|uniref:Uncharacterized protein n=1 Tax=Platanthera guangdongensis TaxID=2320717 RepID=A0ABR2LWC1_9ASPA